MHTDHPIVSHFRDIELLLKKNLNASGHGTKDLIESVSDALPETTKIVIRQLARTRNRHIHEGVTPNSIDWFVSACNAVKQDLKKISNGNWNAPSCGDLHAHIHTGNVYDLSLCDQKLRNIGYAGTFEIEINGGQGKQFFLGMVPFLSLIGE